MFAAIVAGCSGNNALAPSGGTGCTAIAPPALLFPAPGAAGINAGHLQLYFGYPSNPGPSFAVPSLTANNGGATVTGGPYSIPSPGPVPPGSLPLPPGDKTFVSDIANYAAGTTYTVSVTNVACNSTYTVGAFST